MPLFNPPTNKDSFFVPDPGTYVLELTGVEAGPELQFGPTIKWRWNVYDMQGSPIQYEGRPAETDALSSQKMGPRAKARKWMTAHLARDLEEGEDPSILEREVIGTRVMGMFGPNESGKNTLLQVTQYAE
tara:strand:+ start:566 stop:955 length:390 start_codon:yes stop_codon:yes gene_type:complete